MQEWLNKHQASWKGEPGFGIKTPMSISHKYLWQAEQRNWEKNQTISFRFNISVFYVIGITLNNNYEANHIESFVHVFQL